MNEKQFISTSVDETQRLAQCLGESLEGGITILLFGDLGSGKTAFVQGLARGLGVPEKCYVTSPTYTLVNEYPGKYPIFHVDLYRLNGPDDLEDIGFYDILSDQHHVMAVEWAERLDDDILYDSISIYINILDTNKRSITLSSKAHKINLVIEKVEKLFKTKPGSE